jgi:uncharacterized protein YkwD
MVLAVTECKTTRKQSIYCWRHDRFALPTISFEEPMSRQPLRHLLPLVAALFFLTACGGGGGSDGGLTATTATVKTQTATDGLTQFNLRRQQLGLQVVVRNDALIDAAQRHSEYQAINSEITHEQTAGKPGFTGVTVGDRLQAANYQFTQNSYAYGEVISKTSDPSGSSAAEDLIAAIYHRFVIFEPMFKEVGVGAAAVGDGPTYFTTDFAANGLDTGLGAGNFVMYPRDGQQNVPRVFYSDNEVPDPVPTRNAVGYPISIHADILGTVTVQSFTVRPQNGLDMQVQLLSNANDQYTRSSVAAIVPLDVLAAGTIYEVRFIGSVDGFAVDRSWSFTTQ